MQGQGSCVAASNIRYRRPPRSRTGPEDGAAIVQSPDQLPNALPIAGRHQLGRATAGEPTHRYHYPGRHEGVDVHDGSELDLGLPADTRPITQHCTRGNSCITIDLAAAHM